MKEVLQSPNLFSLPLQIYNKFCYLPEYERVQCLDFSQSLHGEIKGNKFCLSIYYPAEENPSENGGLLLKE